MKPTDDFGTLYASRIQRAVQTIRDGGVVAIPTETYYGIAVDPTNEEALSKLFHLKQRPISKPILVLIHALDQLHELTPFIPECYKSLIDEYWPGPLTLVFPARPGISPLLTAGTGTIGIRLTPHPIPAEVIRRLGHPITATSANISGREAARSAAQVDRMFGSGLDYILDGGSSEVLLPSTVIRQSGEEYCIERHGSIDLRSRVPMCKE